MMMMMMMTTMMMMMMMKMIMISSSIHPAKQKKTLQNLDSKYSFHFHHNKQKFITHVLKASEKKKNLSYHHHLFQGFVPRIHPRSCCEKNLLDLWEHLWLLRRQAHMTSSCRGKMKKKPRHCLNAGRGGFGQDSVFPKFYLV